MKIQGHGDIPDGLRRCDGSHPRIGVNSFLSGDEEKI
jgi:hypothetical protein